MITLITATATIFTFLTIYKVLGVLMINKSKNSIFRENAAFITVLCASFVLLTATFT